MATTSSSGPRRPRARAPDGGSPGSRALVARDLPRGAHGRRGQCDLRRCLPPCEPRALQSANEVSATALGYTGGHDRTWHRQAPPGHLLPGLAPRAPSSFARLAPTSVIATCYVLGVSTRRLEKLARAPPITKLPKSQILQDGPQPQTPSSRAFHTRPPDGGPYPIVWQMPWWSRYERPAGPSTSMCSSSLG